MNKAKLHTWIVPLLLLVSCSTTLTKEGFLVLGDSYSCGTGIAAEESFPSQLADLLHLSDEQFFVVAKNGWTTENLLDSLRVLPKPSFQVDFITLLIGVNDQYDGVSISVFLRNFQEVLTLIEHTWPDVPVIVLSIPDYGVTPFGMEKPETTAREIDQFNSMIAAEIAVREAQFHYVDITTHYRKIGGQAKSLAPDQLHPSKTVYQHWVKEILAKLGEN